MKRFVLLSILLTVAGVATIAGDGVRLNTTNFSAPLLKALQSDEFDWDSDGILDEFELVYVEELNLEPVGENNSIDKGWEYLTELETIKSKNINFLDCSSHDRSVLATVKSLTLDGGKLTMDITNFGDLERLTLDNVDVETLDLSAMSGLESISITNCPKLETVIMPTMGSHVQELILTGNLNLKSVDISTLGGLLSLNISNSSLVYINAPVFISDFYSNNNNVEVEVENLALSTPYTSAEIGYPDMMLDKISNLSGATIADGKITFTSTNVSYDYAIAPGQNARFSFTLKIEADTEAPEIKDGARVLSGTVNYTTGVTLTITDNKGVTSVTVNGAPASAPYIIPGVDGTYVVEAKDAAGNTTKVTIAVKLPVVPDTEAPVIMVAGTKLNNGSTTNFLAAVLMDITDNVGLSSVTINGTEKLYPYSIAAVSGTYTVVAKDAEGNTTTVTIVINIVSTDPEPYVPTDPKTTVFRKVKSASFVGIEVLSQDDDLKVVVDGRPVQPVPVEATTWKRIPLSYGSHTLNIGAFKNVVVDIER